MLYPLQAIEPNGVGALGMETTAEDAAGNENRLSLTPVLDLRVAEPLLQAFREAVEHGGELVIDASMVERMSTPCIQILLAATAELETKGVPFSLFGPTDAFIEAFDDLGLFPVLMKWKVTS